MATAKKKAAPKKKAVIEKKTGEKYASKAMMAKHEKMEPKKMKMSEGEMRKMKKIVSRSTPKYGDGGKQTPFQQYLKTPGAVASDTVAQTQFAGRRSTTKMGMMDIKAKNPKNQSALEKAYAKTYGDDIKDRYTDPQKGETNDQYNRRMGTAKYRKGGKVGIKRPPLKKVNTPKMKKGGKKC